MIVSFDYDDLRSAKTTRALASCPFGESDEAACQLRTGAVHTKKHLVTSISALLWTHWEPAYGKA